MLLRKLDCFVPSGIGKLLAPMFAKTESKRHYSYLPGFTGVDVEERKDGDDRGPGDFAAEFKPYIRSFKGLGTEQGSGRR